MFNFSKTYNWKAFLIFILFAMSSSLTQARTAELVDPAPIKVPEDATSEQVRNAVLGAVSQKNWKLVKIISESPYLVEIEYHIRSHIMVMQIEYAQDNIYFSYVRSTNLNYKVTKKKTIIHPNYMVWSQQLADQIKDNLNKGKDYKPNVLAEVKSEDQPPKEPFSAFGQFKFEPTTLATYLSKEQSAIKTSTNLDHNISIAMQPKSSVWNKPENTRTLKIKTHISDLRFISGGTRFFIGRMAGRSNIQVDVTFIDQTTGEVIDTTVLYRIAEAANGFTLARADYAMVEAMGRDVVNYIDKNYEAPIIGGTKPTDKPQ